jgi:vacuolar-type H+-ATPase subunit H
VLGIVAARAKSEVNSKIKLAESEANSKIELAKSEANNKIKLAEIQAKIDLAKIGLAKT